MKSVFHIITHFDIGGAERIAIDIAKSRNPEIEYRIIEVLRSHSDFSTTLLKELDDNGIKYSRGYVPEIHFHYLFEKFSAIIFPFWFVFIFFKYRPDVIHCHTEIPDLAVFSFFKLFPFLLHHCKIVRTIHNTRLWTGMKKTGRIVEKWMCDQNANVAISKSVQECYFNIYGQRPPVVYNGVETVMQSKVYPNLYHNKVNVLFAGRFEEQKGISHLISIIRRKKNDERFFFHVFGDGRLKNRMYEQLDDCHNVKINDPLYDLRSYLPSFDLLFMPSEHEGLGILSIEASFGHLPVIINNCQGLRETLPANWKLKVDNNDIQSYLDLFDALLDKAFRRKMGIVAYEYVNSNFSLIKMQKEYEKIYRI